MENAPEHPFSQVARQANKLMDQMQKGFYVYSGETWTPNVNLYETAGSYFVCVDLAGVDKEKIDVEVVDQRLKLRGTRAVPSYDDANPEHAGGGPAGAPEAGAPEPRPRASRGVGRSGTGVRRCAPTALARSPRSERRDPLAPASSGASGR